MKCVYLFLLCHTALLWSCDDLDNSVEAEESIEKPEVENPDEDDEGSDGFVDDADFESITLDDTLTPISGKQFDAQKLFFAMKAFATKKKYEQLVGREGEKAKIEKVVGFVIKFQTPSPIQINFGSYFKKIAEIRYYLIETKTGPRVICSYRFEQVQGTTMMENLQLRESEKDGVGYLSVKSPASQGALKGFTVYFKRKQLESINFLVHVGGGKGTPTLKRKDFTIEYLSAIK